MANDNNTSAQIRQQRIVRVTLIGSIGNLLLMIFKFVAGVLGRSSAMIADAVHSLTDLVSDAIVLVFVKLSNKPQDRDHEYGHGKYETLATAVIGLLLLGVGIYIFIEAADKIWRFAHGQSLEQPRIIALIAAIASIIVKEGLYHYTIRNGRLLHSPAVIANAWHHRSDSLSSIGTLLGIGGAIILGAKWAVLDPIAAAIVSILIVKVSIDLMKDCMGDLLDKSLPEELEAEILDQTKSVANISEPHNLRTRRIGNRAAVDLHVRVPGNMTVDDSHELTREIERRIRAMLGPDTIVTIHVEPVK